MADDQRRRMRGEVFPIRGRRCPRPGARSPAPPGTRRPTVRWGRQGGGAGQRSRGRGRGRGFAARPPPPSCLAEYASVTAGRTPGVTDQHLRRSEAWLGKRRRLAGVIRAVVAGPPPKTHRRGRGRREHLARPWRGAGGRIPIICQGISGRRTPFLAILAKLAKKKMYPGFGDVNRGPIFAVVIVAVNPVVRQGR